MIRGFLKLASIHKNTIPPAIPAVFVCLLIFLTGCGASENANTMSSDVAVSADLPAVSENAVQESKVISEDAGEINICGNIDFIPGLDAVISNFNEYYPNMTVCYTDLSAEAAGYDIKETGYEKDAIYRRALEEHLIDGTAEIFISDKILYGESETVRECSADIPENDHKAVDPYILRQCSDAERCFAMPLYAGVSGMLVNKSLLDEYGLTEPSEYFDLILDCDALKSEGITALAGYSEGDMYEDLFGDLLEAELAENSEDMSAADELNNAEDYAGELLSGSFELLKFIRKNRYLDITLSDGITDEEDIIRRFETGEIAFVPANSKMLRCVSTDSIEYGFIPMPMESDGAVVSLKSCVALSLNKNSADIKNAVVFLDFLTSEENLEMIAEAAGELSVLHDVRDAYTDPCGAVLCDDLCISGRVMSIYSDVLREIARGHITALSAVNDFDSRNKKSIKRYKKLLKGGGIKGYESGNNL